MRNYAYPNNLSAKPLIFLWYTGDITILMIGTLLAVISIFQSGNPFMAVLTVGYGILTARFDADARPAIEYFKDTVAYLTKPQIWMYDYSMGNKTKGSASEKDVVQSMQTGNSNGDNNLKKLIFLLAACALVIVALVFYAVNSGKNNQDAADEQASEKLKLDFTDNSDQIKLEWYSESPDLLSYIKSAEGSTVTVTPETLDTKQTGETEITYTVSDTEGHTKNYKKVFVVEDNQYPEINFSEPLVTISAGSEFDARKNISSVIDPIEGDLKYSETSDYSHYTVTSDVNTTMAGTYEVTVSALDANGNKTDGSYSVIVE